MHGMKHTVKLPYCSRYFSGELLNLGWLKAVTVNDNLSARRLEWHHHDELELIFPLRGHYQYEFKRRRPVLLGSDSFIVVPSGVMHRLDEAIDPPGVRIHVYLRDPADRPAGDSTFTVEEYSRLCRTLALHPTRRLHVTPQLKAALSSLRRILAKDASDLSETARMQARFLSCLILCGSVSRSSREGGGSDSHILGEAVKWIERNYSSCVNLDKLIDHIGYSRPRFFTLFKMQTNMTPGEYLRNHRLEKAKEMLLQTDLPAVGVGKACGLGDPAHFSHLFKKMTGRTPLEYRRQKNGGGARV